MTVSLFLLLVQNASPTPIPQPLPPIINSHRLLNFRAIGSPCVVGHSATFTIPSPTPTALCQDTRGGERGGWARSLRARCSRSVMARSLSYSSS